MVMILVCAAIFSACGTPEDDSKESQDVSVVVNLDSTALASGDPVMEEGE